MLRGSVRSTHSILSDHKHGDNSSKILNHRQPPGPWTFLCSVTQVPPHEKYTVLYGIVLNVCELRQSTKKLHHVIKYNITFWKDFF